MPRPQAQNAQDEAAEPSLRRFKAAVVQASSVVFDREGTLEKVRALAREAARKGAQLVLFPEALVSGYPRASTLALLSVREPIKAAKIFGATGKAAWMFPGPLSMNLRKRLVKTKSIL